MPMLHARFIWHVTGPEVVGPVEGDPGSLVLNSGHPLAPEAGELDAMRKLFDARERRKNVRRRVLSLTERVEYLEKVVFEAARRRQAREAQPGGASGAAAGASGGAARGAGAPGRGQPREAGPPGRGQDPRSRWAGSGGAPGFDADAALEESSRGRRECGDAAQEGLRTTDVGRVLPFPPSSPRPPCTSVSLITPWPPPTFPPLVRCSIGRSVPPSCPADLRVRRISGRGSVGRVS
ncbi:unnamed protein product [Prorocentrum cordatum]|uniref:BZIP domain-containing protein n=1 Tax=Prorocentrum cordatum TaxID=2364126 RepID=A0ABN9U9S4_9DINO|nr:unnamed protein product [Polarella glacialis]